MEIYTTKNDLINKNFHNKLRSKIYIPDELYKKGLRLAKFDYENMFFTLWAVDNGMELEYKHISTIQDANLLCAADAEYKTGRKATLTTEYLVPYYRKYKEQFLLVQMILQRLWDLGGRREDYRDLPPNSKIEAMNIR